MKIEFKDKKTSNEFWDWLIKNRNRNDVMATTVLESVEIFLKEKKSSEKPRDVLFSFLDRVEQVALENKFTKKHFIKIELDERQHYYSFGVPGFEICLEPCVEGFEVAIYEDGNLVGEKHCTKTGDYTTSLFQDRSEEDWNRALKIADELFDKYIKARREKHEAKK